MDKSEKEHSNVFNTHRAKIESNGRKMCVAEQVDRVRDTEDTHIDNAFEGKGRKTVVGQVKTDFRINAGN